MNPLHAIVEKARTVRPSDRMAELFRRVRPYWFQERRGHAFTQLHIDVARHATGDFNPFHDPDKWHRIHGNPFGAPIAVGFQLEMLVAQAVEELRHQERVPPFRYARYSFSFADVVRPGEFVQVEVRDTRRRSPGGVSNRVALRRQGRVVLMGQLQAGDDLGRHLARIRPPANLVAIEDGVTLDDGHYLRKRVLQMSDAKNFLMGSLVPPHRYFDELEGRACFPELFPVALISSALLEKEAAQGYDFLRNPLVYTAHAMVLDRDLLRSLRDGDRLCILVDGPHAEAGRTGRDGRPMAQSLYHALGFLEGGRPLFSAEMRLTSLDELKRLHAH